MNVYVMGNVFECPCLVVIQGCGPAEMFSVLAGNLSVFL